MHGLTFSPQFFFFGVYSSLSTVGLSILKNRGAVWKMVLWLYGRWFWGCMEDGSGAVWKMVLGLYGRWFCHTFSVAVKLKNLN
jgi:hypothetical protein